MRRKLILGTGCFILAVAGGLPANAPACYQPYAYHSHSRPSLDSAFHTMDANHDGILTQREFVAAHRNTSTAQAAAHYRSLAAHGGTTTRNGVTGMTLHQFKAAHMARY
jgi:hypothetical protein